MSHNWHTKATSPTAPPKGKAAAEILHTHIKQNRAPASRAAHAHSRTHITPLSRSKGGHAGNKLPPLTAAHGVHAAMVDQPHRVSV
jgi:hypothetical protein